MIWELIATIVAGVGAAGVILLLRKLTGNAIAKWTIPSFAALAMLSFQVYSEYTWFSHQQAFLPSGVVVLHQDKNTAFWRPWSYLYPQTLGFVAADIANAEKNNINTEVQRVNLYFVQRHSAVQTSSQVVHCGYNAKAKNSQTVIIPASGATLDNQWIALNKQDPLLQAVCHS
ncbi:hypothetical protein [Rheinheimera salexigens]|uniref:Uncharacterized protein n=1 Tax=Rheinheimera salexigens TaxID=1628148 RepID=A0A1E7Q629_9GAMM|nr:hypothetical protein [Rheinheimera salexigens]OEY69551.1 hypothetical protein BI198_08245 [Rheinheimera salexigens]